MDKLVWHNEKRKINDLIPYEGNPRHMTEKQVEDLRKSLEKFNLVEIPAVNIDNIIIAGHQRLKILQLLGRGEEEIDIRLPNRTLTLEEVKEYNLRSNKNTGEWDYDLLANFDEELLKESGFESEELDKIFQLDLGEDDFDADAEAEKITDCKVKIGDLYQLGEHRLLCGDSTKKEDVEKLMGGEKADMVFTDPPYSVNYEKKNREVLKSKSYSKIEGDDLSVDEIAENIWFPAFRNMYDVARDNCSYYMTMPQGGDQMMMMMMMMKSGWEVKHELIWIKPSPVFSMGRLDYDYKHEPIIYGWKKNHKFYGNGEFNKSVWEIGREGDKSHPTMKPVKLIENALLNSSQRGDIVIDIFGGSGSTLIACEQLNRKCFMMEIDNRYCEVIINRWEKFTNLKAVKL